MSRRKTKSIITPKDKVKYGAIYMEEKNQQRKNDLISAAIASENNEKKVRIDIDSNTHILVSKKDLKKHGKDYYIEKYSSFISPINRYKAMTKERH